MHIQLRRGIEMADPQTPDELVRYLKASGEDDSIDAKAPVKWDGNKESASLAKDIVAFANSRDGGVLVIGKSEIQPGQFELTGLSEAQAASFETTKVATWVNSRFAPPVKLVCHRLNHDKKHFVVITVSEFEDIPILCVKSYDNPDNPKKPLLRERTIYVRNSNAESAPLGSVDSLRSLIGLSTQKRGDEMLATFSAMLRGKSILGDPSDDQRFENELDRIMSGISSLDRRDWTQGHWRLILRPTAFVEQRWQDAEELEQTIRKHVIHIRDEFPASRRGTHGREWGICNDLYGEVWALSRTGVFVYQQEFRENYQEYRSPFISSQPKENIPAGQWIEYELNLYLLIEFFLFISRLSIEYGPGASLRYELLAESLEGRRLVTTNPRIHLSNRHLEPCRATRFHFQKTLTVEELRTEWKEECATALKRFFELFPGNYIERNTLRQRVERFKNREF